MSNVIIIQGEGNSGKSTTAGFVYEDLIKQNPGSHQFKTNGTGLITVINDARQYYKGELYDFVAVVDVGGKIVVIISAGDEWPKLLVEINGLPYYDVLIVTARTRTSKTFKNLKSLFGKQIIHIERIYKQANNSKVLKQNYVNSIIAKI